MSISSITPLGSPPSRTTQSNDAFVSAMDTWLADQQTMVTELNTSIGEFNDTVNSQLSTTSTTSLALSSGSKSCTVGLSLMFAAGQRIVCSRTSDPAASRMTGLITSYNNSTGALAFTVAAGDVTGSGTYTDWTISIVPDPPALGFDVQSAVSGGYTGVLADANTYIPLTSGGFVVPANSSVAYPIGTWLILKNDSASAQTISITTDTMYLDGTNATGSRSLLAYGKALLVKRTSTTWEIGGDVT